MYFIRVKSRWLNLEYTIQAQQQDGTPETAHMKPDSLWMSVFPGDSLEFHGDEARRVARHLDSLVAGHEPPNMPPSDPRNLAAPPITATSRVRGSGRKKPASGGGGGGLGSGDRLGSGGKAPRSRKRAG